MQPICNITDIVPETGVCALVDGTQVAIFRTQDDKLFAIDNHDPFSNANVLSRGLIGGTKDADGNDIRYVASPIYKQRFNLETGQCLDDEGVKIKTHTVTLETQAIYVSMSP